MLTNPYSTTLLVYRTGYFFYPKEVTVSITDDVMKIMHTYNEDGTVNVLYGNDSYCNYLDRKYGRAAVDKEIDTLRDKERLEERIQKLERSIKQINEKIDKLMCSTSVSNLY